MSHNRAVLWLVVVSLGCFLLYPRVVQVRNGEAWQRSANSLKSIAIALHHYHATCERFPPAVVRDKAGQPLYSWRVLLLPYLEEDNLYRQFKLDEDGSARFIPSDTDEATIRRLITRNDGEKPVSKLE